MSESQNDLYYSGRNEDGSISVVAVMRVSAQDELALRAKHLLDPEDGWPADLGIDAAVATTVLSIIKGDMTWAESGLDRGLVNVMAGASTSAG